MLIRLYSTSFERLPSKTLERTTWLFLLLFYYLGYLALSTVLLVNVSS